MQAHSAWELSRGAGTDLVVLGSGMDFGHEDIRVAPSHRLSFSASEPDPGDHNGNGTAIGGLCASPQNGVGIIGAAPEATLISAKVLDGSGSGRVEDAIGALAWCIDARPKVVVISFGTAAPLAPEFGAKLDQLITLGSVVIAGTKGSEGTPVYPAAHPGVISVAHPDSRSNADLRCWTGSLRVPKAGGGYDNQFLGCGPAALVAGAAAVLVTLNNTLNARSICDVLQKTAFDHVINGYKYHQVDMGAAARSIAGGG